MGNSFSDLDPSGCCARSEKPEDILSVRGKHTSEAERGTIEALPFPSTDPAAPGSVGAPEDQETLAEDQETLAANDSFTKTRVRRSGSFSMALSAVLDAAPKTGSGRSGRFRRSSSIKAT